MFRVIWMKQMKQSTVCAMSTTSAPKFARVPNTNNPKINLSFLILSQHALESSQCTCPANPYNSKRPRSSPFFSTSIEWRAVHVTCSTEASRRFPPPLVFIKVHPQEISPWQPVIKLAPRAHFQLALQPFFLCGECDNRWTLITLGYGVVDGGGEFPRGPGTHLFLFPKALRRGTCWRFFKECVCEKGHI